MRTKNTKSDILIAFGIGALLGAIAYLLIYGFKLLDVTDASWMEFASFDIKQHNSGWYFYRYGDWQFPLGLTDQMTYPSSISVFYTDSIPLLAIPFKVIRNILPDPFQYLGLFGMLCFVLQGGLGSMITQKFLPSKIACAFGAILFVFSPVMLFRMYYHTALAGHFVILLAIYLWLSDTMSWKKGMILWAVVSFLCVSIEVYFLPMCGLILLGYCVQRFASKKHTWWQCVLMIAAYCASALFTIWILGGFYGEVASGSFGFGIFSANMNALVNGFGLSRILPELPAIEYQYEGFGYLGFGLILLLAVVLITGLVLRVRKEKEQLVKEKGQINEQDEAVQEQSETAPKQKGSWYQSPWFWSSFGIGVFAFIWAVGINGYLGDIEVWRIQLPDWLMSFCQIFRSAGRMIWVTVYVCYIVAFTMLSKSFKKSWVQIVILAICTGIQVWDCLPMVELKAFSVDEEVTVDALEQTIAQFDSVVFLARTEDALKNRIGRVASANHMTVSDFYLSRQSEDVVANRRVEAQKLLEGNADSNTIYILNNAVFKENYGLHLYNIDGCIVGTKNPLEGRTEFEAEEGEFFYFEPEYTEGTQYNYGIRIKPRGALAGTEVELENGAYLFGLQAEGMENIQVGLYYEENGQLYSYQIEGVLQDGCMYYGFAINETRKQPHLLIYNSGDEAVEVEKMFFFTEEEWNRR